MERNRLPALRSSTSTVLFPRAATNSRRPLTSTLKWSKRPLTSGKGIALTSWSDRGSPACDTSTSAQSARTHSCFIMTFKTSPCTFVVSGNFPWAIWRVWLKCNQRERENNFGRAGRGSFWRGVSGGTWTVNRAAQLADFLALKRNTALMLGALVLALTGERLWLGFAPKYLETLGAGVLIIGLFDALQTLLGALYAYPGGWLTDRWGQRRSLLLFNALSLGGYCLVLFWRHWLALVLGAFLFLAWSALSLPTTFTVVATSLEARQHTMGIGVQSMVRRVPMMLGPLFGGWLVGRFGWTSGVRWALLVCIVLGLLTAVFQWFMVEPTVGKSKANRATKLAPEAKPTPDSSQPGAAGIPETPSPPSDGGEEGRSVRTPLSSFLSPLLRRGERKKKHAPENLRKKPSAVGFRAVVNSFTPALREL